MSTTNPQNCSHLPPTAPHQPTVTTQKLPAVPYSRAQIGLEDPTLLLYPLLAISMLLLCSSLSLALVVFLRGTKAKVLEPASKEDNHNQECVVQHIQEVGPPVQSSKGLFDYGFARGHRQCKVHRAKSQDSTYSTYTVMSLSRFCNKFNLCQWP